MSDTLSYADAVRLLGGGRSKFVEWADRVTGWTLLGASAAGVGDALGIFDAKAELVRLGHDLVRGVAEQRSGLSRYGRSQRLAAAHAVLVVTAFFEALDGIELPVDVARVRITAAEKLSLAGAGPVDPTALTEALFATAAPTPGPHLPYPRFRAAVTAFHTDLTDRLSRFLHGLSVWDEATDGERRRIGPALEQLPELAAERHRELLARLAVDFPEVGFWIGLHEHEATRAQVQALGTGLDEMRRLLREISTGAPAEHLRAALATAYGAELGRPIIAAGDDVPAGLRVPPLGAAYVPPLCRIVELTPGARPSDESWWDGQPLRDDLWQSLVVHLTGPGAVRAPLLLLGQPGSGKSVLTRVLAAQLPAADFMVVRVVLRDVPAEGEVQDQIEQAVRQDTGERVDWPVLARSAGDAMPVVLLDGFDELLQATGVSQTDYLLRVAAFQRREAAQGRPVAVLVTSRTSVADRAQSPPGTVAARLEPFDEGRVRAWVHTWNRTNREAFQQVGVAPLEPAAVLAHRELAEQPLLLLMLALYDAEGNALRTAGRLRRGELYERLLRRFVTREVTKRRVGLPQRERDDAVEAELRRLAVVAFAMFNRRAQQVTGAELEADLAALPVGGGPPADRAGLRPPLRAAELLLGRFFFVHRARASVGGDQRETYEFLHATFGEYLVARFTATVVDDVVARGTASSLGGSEAPADDLAHALLSYAVLTTRAPVLGFLAESLATGGDARRATWAQVLLRLFRQVPALTGGRRYDGYRPRVLPVTARQAAYSANLLLLTICAAGEVSARSLYPDTTEVVESWRVQVRFWRSQLGTEGWQSLVDWLALARCRDERGRYVVVSRDDGFFTVPPVDLAWTYDRRLPAEPSAGPPAVSTVRDLGARLARGVHLECGVADDTARHALAPLTTHLPSALGDLVDPGSGGLTSAAHTLLDLWLLPVRPTTAEDRATVYLRCAATAATLRATGREHVAAQHVTLLLDRLAEDQDADPGLVFEVLHATWPSVLTPQARRGGLRCLLTALGRDSVADVALADLVFDGYLREGGGPDWFDELAAEVVVRLHERGLPTERIWPT
ncbi:hypothetical protein E1091_08230, partial [Micromonospora fluostatini]